VCLRSPAARTEVRTFCWRAWHIYKTMEHVRLVNYEMGLPVPLLATPLNYLSGDESDAEQIKEARTNRSKRPGLVSSFRIIPTDCDLSSHLLKAAITAGRPI
jgi:hypothetical protein